MATCPLAALHEAGRRVPEDVSVVGFDDTPESAYLWPALTTVHQEFDRLGRQAVALTVRALAGEEEPGEEPIRPTLEVRRSTAPPR